MLQKVLRDGYGNLKLSGEPQVSVNSIQFNSILLFRLYKIFTLYIAPVPVSGTMNWDALSVVRRLACAILLLLLGR